MQAAASRMVGDKTCRMPSVQSCSGGQSVHASYHRMIQVPLRARRPPWRTRPRWWDANPQKAPVLPSGNHCLAPWVTASCQCKRGTCRQLHRPCRKHLHDWSPSSDKRRTQVTEAKGFRRVEARKGPATSRKDPRTPESNGGIQRFAGRE